MGISWGLALLGGCGEGASPEEALDSLKSQAQARSGTPVPACEPETFSYEVQVHPSDDTSVTADAPASFFGLSRTLLSDANPRQEAYLRFSTAAKGFQRARLILHVADGSSDGPALYATEPTWDENSLTWHTRPAPRGQALGNLGAVSAGARVEYDVTAAVRDGGNTHAFVLVPDSGDGTDFYSKEEPRYELQPVLVLTFTTSACTRQGSGGAVTGVSREGGPGDEQARDMAMDANGGFVIAGESSTDRLGLTLSRYRADGAQEWSRVFPLEDGSSLDPSRVTITPLGNILVVGTYSGSPDLGTGPLPAAMGYNLFIAKFTPHGRPVWLKGFSASDGQKPSPIFAFAVTTDAQGSLLVAGYFHGAMNLGGDTLDAGSRSREPYLLPGMFLARFSWEGEHLWSRAWDAGSLGTEGHALATDSAGNVLLGGVASPDFTTGSSELGVTGTRTPFIASFSPADGQLQWSRPLNGASGLVKGLAVLAQDAVAFTGQFSGTFTFNEQAVSSTPSSDLMLGILEAQGTERWARRYGGEEASEYPRRLGSDAAGNLVVMGVASGVADLGGGPISPSWYDTHGFVASYGPTGEHRWSRSLNSWMEPSLLGVQPSGETLAGGAFDGPMTFAGTTYIPVEDSDTLWLRLAP
ncbi:hypothetical protein BON30_31305 [Cystobacter ferrugineus]|uniref:Carbohydrate-binding module family 96 domain-containing protein n=1 Tax=Cystobacter ferrugineus TaxID=83449 RepID=A0A1L9B3X3_9BACT|nr:hypothetical protein BON30_31305 [Cystobacter ferrugineus]